MKLDNKNSAVHLLLDGPIQFGITERPKEMDKILNSIKEKFINKRAPFRQTIQYISDPFYEAYIKGVGKLMPELWKKPIKKSGTFIIPITRECTSTQFYNIETKQGKEGMVMDSQVLQFQMSKDMPQPILISYAHVKDGEEDIAYIDQVGRQKGSNVYTQIALLTSLILFREFCEVETKLIAVGDQTVHLNEKYENGTKLPFEILDSTWFTTLVKSGAFRVGGETGFFRWQPVGTGRTDKKLVYIAPFEKKGYTRKAKAMEHRPVASDGGSGL
jgi:hypothetical protein